MVVIAARTSSLVMAPGIIADLKTHSAPSRTPYQFKPARNGDAISTPGAGDRARGAESDSHGHVKRSREFLQYVLPAQEEITQLQGSGKFGERGRNRIDNLLIQRVEAKSPERLMSPTIFLASSFG
jgi:hypothetical protein